MQKRVRVLAVLLAAAVGVCVPVALAAVTGHDQSASKKVPPRLTASERALYTSITGDQGEWAPQGTAIIDSGFQPQVDGFSFINYSQNFRLNQLFYKQPRSLPPSGKAATPRKLSSQDMRLVFGDRVCADSSLSSNGPASCTLTESAATVLGLANQWGDIGHCSAMTTAAAGLFNSWVTPGAIGAAQVTADTGLNPRVQRAFGRLTMAAHFSTFGFRQESMTDFIGALGKTLPRGRIVHSLILEGTPGGHAVLPLGVLDQGGGRFDIAIYDPNIPNKVRAIHVDTAANSWRYQGTTIPGTTPLVWSSQDSEHPAKIYLGIIDTLFGLQPCVFCRDDGRQSPGETRTFVTFSPVQRVNASLFDSLTLTDLAGQPLDPALYQIIPPLDSALSNYVSGPSLYVDVDASFILRFTGKGVRVSEPFTITAIRPGETRTIKISALSRDLETAVELDVGTAKTRVTGAPVKSVIATQTLETDQASYRFTATQRVRDGQGTLSLQLPQKSFYAVVQGRPGQSAPFDIALQSLAKSQTKYRAENVAIPRRSQLLIDYRGWHGRRGKPHLWLDLRADGVPDREIPLKLMT